MTIVFFQLTAENNEMLISFETMKMLINMLITLNYCRHQKEIVKRNNCSNCVNKRNAFMHLCIYLFLIIFV